jgi:hypothetical protein
MGGLLFCALSTVAIDWILPSGHLLVGDVVPGLTQSLRPPENR